MRIFINCIECKTKLSYWTWASDKTELKMSKGDQIELKCNYCNKYHKYNVDDFKAKESRLALLIGLAIFIIGTPILLYLAWDMLWESGLQGAAGFVIIIGMPSSVYFIISNNESKRVRIFNHS